MPHRHSTGLGLIGMVDADWADTYRVRVRLFVAEQDGGGWRELTAGGAPVVRLAAPDLLRAQRAAARARSGGQDVAVILDVAVAVPGDYRAAVAADDTLSYAGTVAGLTGLIADIVSAGVADGVTLIPAADRESDDLRPLAYDVLRRLAERQRKTA